MKFEHLLSPIKIGNMVMPNRIEMAAMGTGLANDDGTISQQLIDYYVQRAQGGIGLIVTEGACVDPPAGLGGFPRELLGHDDKYIPAFKKLTDAVHKYESKISLQVTHAGRYARERGTGVQPVAPSAIASRYTREMPRELSTMEVEDLVEKFAQEIRRARDGGFDSIQLLASTGYLISGFISPLTNTRTDKYGGDVRGRSTFLVEILKRTRELVGNEFPLECKISMEEFMPGGHTIEESKIVVQEAEKAGASIIHAWAGWHESPKPMLPMSVPRGAYVYLAEATKGFTNLPVTAICRINDPVLADQILAEGKADIVGMGRAALADSYFPNKLANGQADSVRKCIGCCTCFDQIMFSMREVKNHPIICTVNAEVGLEGENRMKPAAASKNVLVVGAGPAGMEVARVAAERGHKVTLWEEKDKLGGSLFMAATPPFKTEINNVVDFFTAEMKRLNIKVELNKKVTPEAIAAEKADEVVMASGSSSIIPNIPGVDGKNVVTAVDVLQGKNGLGKKVVVIGGGLIGSETAEYIHEMGDKEVTVLEMLPDIAKDMGPGMRWVTVSRMREWGINMLTSAKVTGISQSGVTFEKDGGEKATIEADSVVIAVGMKPEKELLEAVRAKVPGVRAVGDCNEVGKILEAVHSGWNLGCSI